MNCIAVDDEPMALDLIKSYISKTSSLDLVASFTNPFEALDYIQQHRVDLLFLDINMPELSGIQLLKALSYQPCVIFTTAYSEYGAESYEYNAVDYLLKPFPYARFMQAVHKALPKEAEAKEAEAKKTESGKAMDPIKRVIFVKSGTSIHKLNLDEILYIEARGNYVYIHEAGKNTLSLQSMVELLDELPTGEFIRIHKSYIVAIRHIDVIEGHQVIVSKTKLPLGVTYRSNFKKIIDEFQ